MSTAGVVSIVVAAIAVAAFVVAAYLWDWRWTGFTGSPSAAKKTLWDWLQLLVIPLALAAVAFALNVAQSNRENRREDERADRERALAADGRREDALQVYLDQMSDLMLDRKLGTSRAEPGVGSVARTLTLTVLRRLDGRRKGFVLKFLNEGGLINDAPELPGVTSDLPDPAFRMEGADLRGVVVRGDLPHVNLDGADLRYADFRGASIQSPSFIVANMRNANFSRAAIIYADFVGAELVRANFSNASVVASDFSTACLTRASFGDAVLRNDKFRDSSGHHVDFAGASFERTLPRRADKDPHCRLEPA
jgi:hypothetical protein